MMDSDHKKSAEGPSELLGDVDYISLSGLLPHYEFFCKRSLPESISDTHYLRDVVGDTEIRKGEGMELGQLIQGTHSSKGTNTHIQPFDLDVLKEAFHLMETDPVDLPSSERGTPIAWKSKSESKDKEQMHEKHEDRERCKHKGHKKHGHWHKHRSYTDKTEEKSRHSYTGYNYGQSRRYHEKKRKHDEDDDSYGHSET